MSVDPVSSILSAGWSLAGQEEPVPQALVGAGRFVMDNLDPLTKVSTMLLGSRDEGRKLGGLASLVMSPAGLGVGLGMTAGIAKLGVELLQRRLQNSAGSGRVRGEKVQKDPLRGVSQRSRTVKKSREGAGQTKSGAGVGSPLNLLCSMFPGLKRNVLADILHSNDGVLEQAVDQVLSLSVDSKTPFPDTEQGPSFSFPSASEGGDGSLLPPCPECPVCCSKLVKKKIYQCSNGHSVCQGCRNNPSLKCCPTCRQKLVGRATNMEQFLATIYKD